MLLPIRLQLITAFAQRLTETDGGHGILQRFAGAVMHMHVSRGYEWHASDIRCLPYSLEQQVFAGMKQ
jgi:hypothetical protein